MAWAINLVFLASALMSTFSRRSNIVFLLKFLWLCNNGLNMITMSTGGKFIQQICFTLNVDNVIAGNLLMPYRSCSHANKSSAKLIFLWTICTLFSPATLIKCWWKIPLELFSFGGFDTCKCIVELVDNESKHSTKAASWIKELSNPSIWSSSHFLLPRKLNFPAPDKRKRILYEAWVLGLEYKAENILANSKSAATPEPFESAPNDSS